MSLDLIQDGTSESRKDAVASLCGQIPNLPTGSKAELRRLYLTRAEQAAGIVAGLLVRAGVPDEVWRSHDAFARWTLLAHAAAVLSGTASVPPHKPSASFGRALHEARYSENRLMRLTSARGPALVDQIVRSVRVLAAAGQAPVDLHTLHSLSFDTGERAESARIRLARQYFAAQYADRKGTP